MKLPGPVFIIEGIALVGLAAIVVDDQHDAHALLGHAVDVHQAGREEHVDLVHPGGALGI